HDLIPRSNSMKLTRRNTIIGGLAGVAAIGLGSLMFTQPAAAQVTFHEYSPEVLAQFEASGEPYILNFWASWCTTCAAQQRVIGQLQAENPAFLDIPIIRVDWDLEQRGELVARLAIPRRSTLVLMRGDIEISRLVADTRKSEIEAMLMAA